MSSKTSCFTCGLDFSTNIDAFVSHMSDVHADDQIKCAICLETFSNGSEYSMHYIYRHVDDKSSMEMTDAIHGNSRFEYASTGPNTSNSNSLVLQANNPCPVCGSQFPIDRLNDHVNSHFEDEFAANFRQSSADFLLAEQLEKTENLASKVSEEKAFKDLQKKYGMDEHGSYKQQGTSAYERAYNKGKMTLSQLYEQKSRLAINQVAGIEDINYAVKDFIENVKELSRRCADVLDAYFCSTADFYSSNAADIGFGCGYRNIQMLISSLRHNDAFKRALFGSGPVYMPSIPKIQELIESAWAKGFDQIGKEQLNGKLTNTKKWIGATEATCLLASFRIKSNIVDFWQPSGPDNNHPILLKWVYEYFKDRRSFTPPLYLQHEGHSRTVIGAERTRSGRYNLIILDPSITRFKILRLVKSTDLNDLKILRKNLNDLRHKQFQIVCVQDVMKSDEEFESYKTKVDLIKIPPISNPCELTLDGISVLNFYVRIC
uniref:Zinc finger-containing ubiquitin peptidase 1 n=1 Tax=Romanomermis culicivorax TaxID=13658 RepID=A0A915JBD9_ROMCU